MLCRCMVPVVGLVAACAASPPKTAGAKAVQLVIPSISTGPAVNVEKTIECPPVAAGEVRDDQIPTIHGWAETVSFDNWMVAHGVDYDAAGRWLAAHFHEDPEAFAPGRERPLSPCTPIVLPGDHEEAVLCTYASSTNQRDHAFAYIVTVRSRQPMVVFETGLSIYYDVERSDHTRWLDLSLALEDGILVLGDRAADGTIVVEGKAACEARYAHRQQCWEKWQTRSESEERVEDADGRPCMVAQQGGLEQQDLPETRFHPARMHDCAHAIGLLTQTRDSSVDKRFKKQQAWVKELWEESLSFARKSCANRGKWVWRGAAYVHDQ